MKKIFVVLAAFLITGCCASQYKWKLTKKDLWNEFINHGCKSKNFCYYLKADFDFYSSSESYRVFLKAKVNTSKRLFLQISSFGGNPLLYLERNNNQTVIYIPKKNKVFVCDEGVNIFEIFGIKSPVDFLKLLEIIKGDTFNFFVDYLPIAQYDNSKQIKFIFKNKKITTIIWKKNNNDLKIQGLEGKIEWKLILKNFDEESCFYKRLSLFYKDLLIKLNIKKVLKKERFCKIKSLLTAIPEKTEFVFIKGEDLWKRRMMFH